MFCNWGYKAISQDNILFFSLFFAIVTYFHLRGTTKAEFQSPFVRWEKSRFFPHEKWRSKMRRFSQFVCFTQWKTSNCRSPAISLVECICCAFSGLLFRLEFLSEKQNSPFENKYFLWKHIHFLLFAWLPTSISLPATGSKKIELSCFWVNFCLIYKFIGLRWLNMVE